MKSLIISDAAHEKLCEIRCKTGKPFYRIVGELVGVIENRIVSKKKTMSGGSK